MNPIELIPLSGIPLIQPGDELAHAFLLVVGTACLLIMAEPDMGTTMVIAFSTGATLIAAGARPADLGKIADWYRSEWPGQPRFREIDREAR